MSRSAMEAEDEEKNKINDDLVVFMRKRSETEAPRYTARLKTYVDFKQKRLRAANACRHSGGHHDKRPNFASRKKNDGEVKDKGAENQRGGDKSMHRTHSLSRSGTGGEEPEEASCPRRRRKCCPRKRRRRSCRRKRGRRSCSRRRRRSCSRRRRRRSCRRRRRRSRCGLRRRRRPC